MRLLEFKVRPTSLKKNSAHRGDVDARRRQKDIGLEICLLCVSCVSAVNMTLYCLARRLYSARMTPSEITKLITGSFGAKILASFPEDKHPRVHVDAENWRALAEFLIRNPALKLDWMANLSGVDYVADDKLCVVYDLWSFDLRHSFAVKVFCQRENAHIPTVADLWPAADWHEREAFDLLGIIFDHHPDLRRILLAEDWEGFPLRKDYIFPREYHGIPGSVELDWQHKPDYPK
jgi:NADH-quinone oxidoreductase subunit C